MKRTLVSQRRLARGWSMLWVPGGRSAGRNRVVRIRVRVGGGGLVGLDLEKGGLG